MSQLRTNSFTKIKPQNNTLHPQAFSFTTTKRNILYKSIGIRSKIPERMAVNTPVEVGTKGTVGSLILQEIEYFSRLELTCQDSSQKPQSQITDTTSTSSHLRPHFRPEAATKKKKKKKNKKGGSRLVPCMCSMVDVSDSKRPIGIQGFNYKNLKMDAKKLQG